MAKQAAFFFLSPQKCASDSAKNRNGQLIYETRNAAPWDGKSDGKNVPIGVYYYNLYLNEDFKLYSGWVMLTR